MGFYDILLAKKLSGNGGGGGGGSSYKLLASQTYNGVVGTSTSVTLGTINAGAEAYTSAKIIYVKVRDKAGRRASHYYGGDYFYINLYPANNQTENTNAAGRHGIVYSRNYNDTKWTCSTADGSTYAGVCPQSIQSTGDITIRVVKTTATEAVDGDFQVDVYALDWPDDISPFLV